MTSLRTSAWEASFWRLRRQNFQAKKRLAILLMAESCQPKNISLTLTGETDMMYLASLKAAGVIDAERRMLNA